MSTHAPLAQTWFDQGLRLLHMGWGAEARRAFAEAARRDPELAMAWWGLALTRGAGSRFAAERAEALRRALALSEGATDREQRYIIAASQLDERGSPAGRMAFVREMESLIDSYPKDAEARLLLAGFLMDGYEPDGRPCAGQPYAQALLRELLRTHPRHEGVHLAWVFAMLGSARPEAAKDSALWLLSLGPRVSPYLIGAGRLLQRIGLAEQARESFHAAIEADDAWLAEGGLPVNAAPGTAEAMQLLITHCASAGRYLEGQAWARRLRGRVEAVADGKAAVLVACTIARLHMRFGSWRAAAEVDVELGEEASAAEQGLLEGLRRYTRGLAALDAGRLMETERACKALTALHESLAQERRTAGQVLCPRDVARVVEVAAAELRGALDARRGDAAQAEESLLRAIRLERRLRTAGPAPFSRPARETLSWARTFTAGRGRYLRVVGRQPVSASARKALRAREKVSG